MSTIALTDLVVRTDGDLVAAARAGDQDALLELLRRHQGSVAAVCARYCRPHELPDATQETIVRALARLGDLRDPDAFGPWLRSIARNVARDTCAQAGRVVPVPDLHQDQPSRERGPDAAVVAAEEAVGLHARLAALGERDGHALWLRDAMGLPVPDIARQFGLTEGSARVMLTRARRRLRESFGGLAAVLGGWWSDLHQRVGQHAGVLHPAWAAAVQVGAVAMVLALPHADRPAPPLHDAPDRVVAQEVEMPVPQRPAVTVEAAAGGASTSADVADAPSDDLRPAPTTAGPVSVGSAPPEDAHAPVGTSVEVAGETVALDLFPGNVIEELDGGGQAGTALVRDRGEPPGPR